MAQRRTATCGLASCRWHKLPQDNSVFQHLMNKQFVHIIENNYGWDEFAILWQLIADG